jgi:hypothetical protein
MKKILLVAVMVILVATMLASTASAFEKGKFYWLDYTGFLGETISWSDNGGTTWSSHLAGAIKEDVYSSSTPNVSTGSFATDKVGNPTTIWTLCLTPDVILLDPWKAKFTDLAIGGKAGYLVTNNELSLTDSKYNAGFQMAVWDLVSPATRIFSSQDSTVMTYYNQFMGQVLNISDNNALVDGFNGDQDGNPQTQNSQSLTDPSVPEFPAAALAPLGLFAFGFIKRKFAK